MSKITIIIKGEVYPCEPTMGAMLRFHEETGREVTAISSGSISDLCTYLYCCVVSASNREGKKFDMSLMDFADSITPSDMSAWSEYVTKDGKEDDSDGEKKSLSGSLNS